MRDIFIIFNKKENKKLYQAFQTIEILDTVRMTHFLLYFDRKQRYVYHCS